MPPGCPQVVGGLVNYNVGAGKDRLECRERWLNDLRPNAVAWDDSKINAV